MGTGAPTSSRGPGRTGGGPHVEVFSGADLSLLASFYAYDPFFSGGVTVAAGDLNGDGRVDLITGAGPGGPDDVRVFSGLDGSELLTIVSPTIAQCGVFVGALGDGAGLRFTSAETASFAVGGAGSFTVTTTGVPVPALTVSGTLPAGVSLVDHGDGTATLRDPRRGHRRRLSAHVHGDQRRRHAGDAELHADGDTGPGDDERQRDHVLDRRGRHLHGDRDRLPGADPHAGRRALPAGVTFVDHGNGTGTLSGTPAAGTAGSYALQFTAANGVGADAVQTFTLTVSGAPAFTSASATTFTVGSRRHVHGHHGRHADAGAQRQPARCRRA